MDEASYVGQLSCIERQPALKWMYRLSCYGLGLSEAEESFNKS
jgi:hypothetical protein